MKIKINVKAINWPKTLLGPMKKQLLSFARTKGVGRVLKDSPFRRLPAARTFTMGAKKYYNPLLYTLGMRVRIPREKIIEGLAHEECNHYMKYIIMRIRKLVSDGKYKKAWTVALLQIRYSKVFRASAFNFVCKGWYYNKSINDYWKINRKVDNILRNERSDLDYKRVYIPKANGKMRPLGVPKVEWRIALNLYNNFMIEIMRNQIQKCQHAYLPGKGVMSAWREMIPKLEVATGVWETDLQSFFPSVSVWKIVDILKESESPISKWFLNLCKSIPKFPETKLLDESKYDIIPNRDKGFWSPEARPLLKSIFNLEMDLFGENKINLSHISKIKTKSVKKEILATDIINLKPWIKSHKPKEIYINNIMDPNVPMFQNREAVKLKVRNYGIIPGGVPQGTSISPFLSILCLKEYLSQADCVNYADDQVFFTNNKTSDFPQDGIVESKEKSKWVVKEGAWITEGLKFLGLRINQYGELKSETKSGIKSSVHKKLQMLYSKPGLKNLRNIRNVWGAQIYGEWINSKAEEYEPTHMDNWESLKNISKRKIFGFILSCMNINDWENNHSERDQAKAQAGFRAKLNRKSLLKRVPTKVDSSHSIPFLLDIVATVMDKGRNKKSKSKSSKLLNMLKKNIYMCNKSTNLIKSLNKLYTAKLKRELAMKVPTYKESGYRSYRRYLKTYKRP